MAASHPFASRQERDADAEHAERQRHPNNIEHEENLRTPDGLYRLSVTEIVSQVIKIRDWKC
jgi:hypothetical protein